MDSKYWVSAMCMAILAIAGFSLTGCDQPQGGTGITEPAFCIKGEMKMKMKMKSVSLFETAASEKKYLVIAVSVQSSNSYYGSADADGKFWVALPDSEKGNTFVVTVMDKTGQAIGPVMYGVNNGAGSLGLEVKDKVDLGAFYIDDGGIVATITNPSTYSVNTNYYARVGTSNLAVGIASFGKAAGAQVNSSKLGNSLGDKDRDGLIDILDADDDGDGVADDFESDRTIGDRSGLPKGYSISIVQTLSLQEDQLKEFYVADVSNALAKYNLLGLWVKVPPTAAVKSITVLDSTAPSYLSGIQSGPQQAKILWSSEQYMLPKSAEQQHPTEYTLYKAHLYPNVALNAGDAFTFKVIYEDGKTNYYTRMLNYVFKDSMKLSQYSTNAKTSFITYPVVSGRPPMRSDQDLYLTLKPPLDDTGSPITNVDRWKFIFGYGKKPTGGNDQVFSSPTVKIADNWNTTESNAIGHQFGEAGNICMIFTPAEMGTFTGGAYTIKIPKELFKTNLTISGSNYIITSYTIGVTITVSDSINEYRVWMNNVITN